MSRIPKMTPAVSVLDKPAKQRIVEKAESLFIHGGVNVSIAMIADFAHTNVKTVLQHFGHRDRLVFDFLKSLMEEAERSWNEIEQAHPNDPAAQVRSWVSLAEMDADLSSQGSQAQLARAAVDLLQPNGKSPFSVHLDGKSQFLVLIERFWQAERNKIARLCERAKFRDPSGLADKLLLLVMGARNERNCYGYPGPSAKLVEAGDDLMAAHAPERL